MAQLDQQETRYMFVITFNTACAIIEFTLYRVLMETLDSMVLPERKEEL